MNVPGFTGDLGLEAAALGKALLTGAALGLYYDLYRILRRLFHFGYAMILAQDVIFWVSGAVGVFFASVVVSGGQLRIFFVLTALVGWGIYAATVGSLLMMVVDAVVGVLRAIFRTLKKRLLVPVFTRIKAASAGLFLSVKRLICRIKPNLRKKREKIP